ncbi:MAG: hypothetical protein ABIH46_13980 [Chloroflexota bacterium]
MTIVEVYPIFAAQIDVPDEELDLEGLTKQEADEKRLDWIDEHCTFDMYPPHNKYLFATWTEAYDAVRVGTTGDARWYDGCMNVLD